MDIAMQYTNTINTAMDTLAPLKLRPAKLRTTKSKSWFTPELHKLLTTKRAQEAIWRKDPTLPNKSNYILAAKNYKTAIISTKAQSYISRIEKASSSQKELFAILRELENPTPKETTPQITKDDSWCASIQAALNNKIATLHTKIAAKLATLPPTAKTHTKNKRFIAPPFHFQPLSEAEVAQTIKGLKPSPCKGDSCPAPIIKDCAVHLIPIITAFINTSFTTSSVPSIIKEAWITPLLKKPTLDPNNPNNYRPITNVPFLLKILDRAAYLQIQRYLEINKLLGNRQSGFRPGHSTETALLDLKIQMDKICDDNCLAALLLLDLSAAFDLVDHATLCSQLVDTVNFSPEACSWIASFLADRKSRVFSSNSSATPCPTTCGVPQGSCVSPTLYNIYTKPLFDQLDSLGVIYTNFADDTQILITLTGIHSADSLKLNHTYELIQAWMAKHHLCLNDEKTELLITGTAHKLKSLPPEFSSFRIADNTIPALKHVKTLGVYLDAELSMTRQVNAISSAASYRIKLINAIRPFLSSTNCANVARAVIGTRLDYCNVLLCGTSKQNIKKLQTVQNNAVRAILGLDRRDHISQARRELHWLPIQQRIAFKMLSISHRCLSNSVPSYLNNCVQRRTYNRSLRACHQNLLLIPRYSRKRAGGSSFCVLAPNLWNSLPGPIRTEHSYWVFRKLLKTHLFI